VLDLGGMCMRMDEEDGAEILGHEKKIEFFSDTHLV
jgi:hypothetical protein